MDGGEYEDEEIPGAFTALYMASLVSTVSIYRPSVKTGNWQMPRAEGKGIGNGDGQKKNKIQNRKV